MSQIKVNSIIPVGGAPAGGGGGIIQCVQTVMTTKTSQSVTGGRSNWTNITNFSLSITPSSANSKILLMADFMCSYDDQYYLMAAFRWTRNGTAVGLGPTESNFEPASYSHARGSFDNNGASFVNMHYLDSPATTSSITYRVQHTGERTGLFYMNRTNFNYSNTSYSQNPISTFTALEVSG